MADEITRSNCSLTGMRGKSPKLLSTRKMIYKEEKTI